MNDPRNEPDLSHLFVCESCYEVLDRLEAHDPCVIDGKTFCDVCASNLSYLRLEGYISEVAPKVSKVVEAHNRALDAELAEMIYPTSNVRHI